ncbi:flagellar assembly protein FliX [Caulobacter sp. DWR3-1-2]|uniref:flagellar assembly regulator FliX n=1 Tax=Caulobacter sp. DWR3-1-2 TaxID=2804647 RepID=UPI0019A89E93|nr:flagellar assembly protein FliX [Caulobacter sp.]
MKVSSTGGAGAVGASRAKPTGGGGSGFSLPTVGGASAASGVAQTGGVTGVGSLDALLALQANLDPLERKRRAVKRAGGLLDILDALKISVLDGEVSTQTLSRLKSAVREHRESTDDPGLETILNEIETRAAVEAAKLEQARLG